MEYANGLAQRGHTLYLVAPHNSADLNALPELYDRITIIESTVSPKKQSFLTNIHLSLSLSRAIPPCDLVISTHTPTTVPSWLAARLWHRTKLIWLYMDYKEMFEDRPIELFLLKHAARWHDKILTISNFCRQKNLAMSGVDATVVGLGLSDTDVFRPGPILSRQTNIKTILYLGDDRPRKGLRDFLAACKQIYAQDSDIEIVIVSKWKFEVDKQLPISFCLKPTQEELAQLYRKCDVFVFTSWREGFGLPPLEAMACSAPVVLTDSGGVREYARHQENCLMVPPKNPNSLAMAIQSVLDDPNLTETLRQNGPPTAKLFNWTKAVDRFEVAIQSVVTL